MFWSERHGQSLQQNQIRNNLRDIARRAGIQITPHFAASHLGGAAVHLTLDDCLAIAEEHDLAVPPEVRGGLQSGRNAARAYLLPANKEYTGGVEVCWLLPMLGPRSLVARVTSTGLTTTWVASERVVPIDDAPRLEEMASMGGKYQVLLHRVNAPNDLAVYGYRTDLGLFESPPGHRGHPQLETGYWVYVYPTWYVWKTSSR